MVDEEDPEDDIGTENVKGPFKGGFVIVSGVGVAPLLDMGIVEGGRIVWP